MMTKLSLAGLTRVFAMALAVCSAQVLAQAWPTRAVTIVVPYAPGATDQETRRLADALSKNVGQPVIVVNKDGAGGAIGAQFVASAKPDGYTLMYAAPAVITVAPLLGNTQYKYEDLMPIARATSSFWLLVGRLDAPFKNIAELIAYAKANPGKVTFGTSGIGTAVHLAAEALADVAGIRLTHVPYRGLNLAVTAALGGVVDLVIGSNSTKQQVDAGKLRALAQFGSTRLPALSDVPTLRELGMDLTLGIDNGLFAPAGIPAPLAARISDAIAKALNSEEFQGFAAKLLATPAYLPPDEYRKLIEVERALNARIVPRIKLNQQ